MATIAAETTGSLTVTETETGRERARSEKGEEEATIPSLLVSLDACARNDLGLVSNTVSQLVALAREQGEAAVSSTVRSVLLIAFKRRNHGKSQAEGEGAGEKSFFLEVLLSVLALKDFDALLLGVLPLVSLYGCWRDARLLGEELLLREELLSREGEQGPAHPVYKALCKLFAEQLLSDAENTEKTPSNACKHAPHEHRYGRGERKAIAAEEEEAKAAVSESTDVDATSTPVEAEKAGKEEEEEEEEDRPPRRSRGRARPAKRRYSPAATSMVAKYTRLQRHDANARFAKDIARIACAAESERQCGAAAYRKLRAGLNKRLTEQGHLVETHMCAKTFDKIDFEKANKGALNKYKASLTKHEQMPRWQQAMRKSLKAVPDLDSIPDAMTSFFAEAAQNNPETAFFHRSVEKARVTMKRSHDELLRKAKSLLRAAANASSAEDGEKKATTSVPLVPLLVAVDTGDNTNRDSTHAILFAAFLVAKAQNAEFFAVNGRVVELAPFNDTNWVDILLKDRSNSSPVQRFRDNVQGLLRRVSEQNTAAAEEEGKEKTTVEVADVLFICQSFSAYEQDKDSVLSEVEQAQKDALDLGVNLRALRVHRLQAGDADDEGEPSGEVVEYVPRPDLRSLPADPAELTVDLLFVVDFTGSMGMYMDAVKKELVGVISTIRDSVRLKNVRVALVGYRDYSDARRVVKVDFHDASNLDALLESIKTEDASGGGDTPEDLLSGLVAAAELSWQSHIRLQVIITDANAHGFEGYGDHHPSGRCPDQRGPGYPSLREITQQLAEKHVVDTFFCQLNSDTVATQRELFAAYADTRGFGTIWMGRNGSDNFRRKIIASISKAVLSTITKEDVKGLQTYDGITVSSLTASLNSSLRETLSQISASLTASEDEKEKKIRIPDSDWDRLERELQVDALNPVRLALGMQVFSASKLSHAAQFALFKAGVTAEMLSEKSYPQPMIDAYSKFLLELLSKA